MTTVRRAKMFFLTAKTPRRQDIVANLSQSVRKLLASWRLGGLRILFAVSIFSLSACGTGKPAPVVNYGVQGGATSAGAHTVTAGETLWDIAGRYRVDMKDIVYVNNLSAPYFLENGARLMLPPPMTYKAKPGDTLYDISRVFNVSMTQLVQQNKLKKPYKVRAGDILRLPSIRPEYQDNPQVQVALAKAAAVTREDLPPVTAQRVETVQKQLSVPTKTPALSGGGNGKFAWPVDGPLLSSYGPKKDGLHNDGINIKAPNGAPVRAAENGVVVYADNQLAGFGNLVLVRHADRWMTAYGHLGRIDAKRGDTVRRGQTIGIVGSSGSADAPQLHFEIRRGTEALNPEQYLARLGT